MFYIDNDLDTIDKFDLCKFMEMSEDGAFDPLNSYILYQIPLLPVYGTYKIRKEEKRPDLLAHNIYGNTQYWWVLLWYNGLMSPYDLKAGLQIKYPSLSNLEQLYLQISMNEKTKAQ